MIGGADAIHDRVRRYYTEKVLRHGASPAGADWNSAESQTLRFDQLVRIAREPSPASWADFGCGYGALVPFLESRGLLGRYGGFDLSEAMVEEARRLHGGDPRCAFTTDPPALAGADYAVASGIFNVKMDVETAAWEAYVKETLGALAGLGRKGFAFNLLTGYADREKMRPDLYYADPGAWLDHCVRTFSRHVALLHDYGLWEWTLLVRR